VATPRRSYGTPSADHGEHERAEHAAEDPATTRAPTSVA
jgi:hypothetical protein